MSMNFSNFDINNPLWQGILLAIMLVVTLLVAWPPLKKIRAHRELHRLIRRLGPASLQHVALMDGADVPLYIEHLILQPGGLLLLIVKPFRGNIFAAEKIENWTQVVRHHSFKFANPLHELETNLQALRGMLPKLTVRGLVVFTQGASFPKGKPEHVCDFDELKAMAGKQEKGEVPESLQQAWAQLGNSLQRDKKLIPAILYQRGDKRRLFAGIFLLSACLIYFAWIIGWLQKVV